MCLSVCVRNCPNTNKRHFYYASFIWVGPDQRKKSLDFGKDLDHTLDTKNNTELLTIPVSIFFFGLWLKITLKLIDTFLSNFMSIWPDQRKNSLYFREDLDHILHTWLP